MSTAKSLEERVAELEAQMAQVTAALTHEQRTEQSWLERVYGSFANDPIYDEAMRLGREYRESLRPKPRNKPAKPRKKRHGDS
jgi:hypothetical protein